MMSYAHQIATSPSLGAAICSTVATSAGSLEGQRSDFLIRTRPRRPWGAAICATVALRVSSWEGQRSDVLRTLERDLAAPGGLRPAKLSPLS